MSKSSRLTNRAIELCKAGNKADAGRLLRAVLRDEPTNQTAWNWYIETSDTPQERIQALEEYLLVYPDNMQALHALSRLKSQENARIAASQSDVSAQKIPTQPIPPQPAAPITVAATKPNFRIPWGSVIAVLSILLLIVLLGYTYTLQRQDDLLNKLYASLQGNYTNLQIAHEVNRQEKVQLKTQLEKLQVEYDLLNTAYKDLSKAYTDLESKIDGTSINVAKLDDQYKDLSNNYGELQADYAALETEYSTLTDQTEALRTNYSGLYGWYSWLQDNAITTPYIAIHDGQVTLGIKLPDGSLHTWTKDVSELEQAITTGANIRANPSYVYLDVNGNKVVATNYSPYIDSEPFKDFIPALYASSSSDSEFIQNVRKIISQLSVHNTEGNQIPHLPLETFLKGGGDSEDLSILLASMLMAAPADWDVRLVFMDIDHPQNAQTINHMIVYVDTGEEKLLLEPTNPDAFWTFDTQGWSLDVSH
jgi:predicted nuclease with TOPRIM domain